jgi:hypothetical protein
MVLLLILEVLEPSGPSSEFGASPEELHHTMWLSPVFQQLSHPPPAPSLTRPTLIPHKPTKPFHALGVRGRGRTLLLRLSQGLSF